MKSALSQATVGRMNVAFEKATPQQILAWTLKKFSYRWWWPFGRYYKGVILAWGGGYPGCALVHMASQVASNMDFPLDVFTVDTLKLFPQAHELIPRLERKCNVVIERFYPLDENIDRFKREFGNSPDLWDDDTNDICCAIRKGEPQERAIRYYGAWITSIQRSQRGRENTRIFAIDRGGIIKVAPFAYVSPSQIEKYMTENDVPYNPLHDQNYPSIGCNEEACTRPVRPGEGERDGRWPKGEKRPEQVKICCPFHNPKKKQVEAPFRIIQG